MMPPIEPDQRIILNTLAHAVEVVKYAKILLPVYIVISDWFRATELRIREKHGIC